MFNTDIIWPVVCFVKWPQCYTRLLLNVCRSLPNQHTERCCLSRSNIPAEAVVVLRCVREHTRPTSYLPSSCLLRFCYNKYEQSVCCPILGFAVVPRRAVCQAIADCRQPFPRKVFRQTSAALPNKPGRRHHHRTSCSFY